MQVVVRGWLERQVRSIRERDGQRSTGREAKNIWRFICTPGVR
jgi:hypothetical protein